MVLQRFLLPLAMSLALQANPPAEIEKRIDALLGRMTLQEKLGQMSQSTSLQAPLSGEIRQQIRRGRWGSFLNAGLPPDRMEAQRIAVKESRLGIPLLFGRDVIHGYRTVFPIPLGQSATWDLQLIERAAAIAAKEASAEGIHWTFAPMLDITRDPRWGRVAETLGEDPYLTGELGAAMIRGFQGKSPGASGTVAACAKHFAGYGAAEGGRDYNSTFISEDQLRALYLPPFQAAVRSGVATFMTSFNALNGVPATGNQFLLDRILRKEWGFEGMVVSDYESIVEMVKHGTAADPAEAALQALTAGVDMEMVSTGYFDQLPKLIQQGRLSMSSIDRAVRNILRLKFQLGLFDDPLRAPTSVEISADARQIARQMAVESFVLLKNEKRTLPLASTLKRIAVIGPLADSPVDQLGSWVMDARPEEAETPLTSLRSKYGEDRILYVAALKNSRDANRDQFGAAVAAARESDVVLLFLGEEQILSGEARSRAFLNLPGAQEELVQAVASTGRPIVSIILAGRPLTFHEVAARSASVLYAWHPGTMGGPALADVLSGERSPSGKLAITFPRTVGQIPIYYAHLNTGRPAAPGDFGAPMGNPVDPQGYTSKYLDADVTPEYPFGFGLSYSSFAYSAPRVSRPAFRRGGSITVSADVTNTGSMESDEVVQFYIRDLVASVARPVRELKGFRRIRIRPGEKQTVSFTLSEKELAFYNRFMQLVAEPGEFQAWIAPDSSSGSPVGFRLEADGQGH
ncbi:MAG: glycoside hydrolase family 3 N-terminal domain-containing protein [Bryobacteraceae bacterium]